MSDVSNAAKADTCVICGLDKAVTSYCADGLCHDCYAPIVDCEKCGEMTCDCAAAHPCTPAAPVVKAIEVTSLEVQCVWDAVRLGGMCHLHGVPSYDCPRDHVEARVARASA